MINMYTAFCSTEELFVVKLSLFNLFTLILLEPFDAFAFFPETTLNSLSWNYVSAQAVLLAFKPLTHIATSI